MGGYYAVDGGTRSRFFLLQATQSAPHATRYYCAVRFPADYRAGRFNGFRTHIQQVYGQTQRPMSNVFNKLVGITSITYHKDLGSTPARVNRKTGELQINMKVWPKL